MDPLGWLPHRFQNHLFSVGLPREPRNRHCQKTTKTNRVNQFLLYRPTNTHFLNVNEIERLRTLVEESKIGSAKFYSDFPRSGPSWIATIENVNKEKPYRLNATSNQIPIKDVQFWRYGKFGNFRQNCRAPPKLFCSRCKKEGVMTSACKDTAEDAAAAL